MMTHPSPTNVRRLILYLVKPSRYDDDGYVVRHWRGALPSNTLAVLKGLTETAHRSGVLGTVDVRTVLIDETVDRVPFRRIRRQLRQAGTRVAVGLCGVQTNQMARAMDVAEQLHRAGATVLIGGFHVSGANALVPGVSPEIRKLLEMGVHVIRGEVDECWGQLLRQVIDGSLPPMVNQLHNPPDLTAAATAAVDRRYLKKFAMPDTGTIDAGRGCVFNCSFCTITQVQGRRMRARRPEDIVAAVRGYHEHGIRFIFFTDDNFARNPGWGKIFDGLMALREAGCEMTFMMQVDVLAPRIAGFVDQARRAGCVQVFIGLESLNPQSLASVGKRQNRVGEFRDMIDAWHEQGIITNCGYILGFPADTPDTIAREVQYLRDELQTDLASFFMLTPLPGSADHARMVMSGERVDPDWNLYDSFHAVTDHPQMTGEQWRGAYIDAWRQFYTRDHMTRCLRRFAGRAYWSLFNTYLWYRHSIEMGEHPMVSGFLRMRDRDRRRPGTPAMSRAAHAGSRIADVARQARIAWRLALEMQDLWLATRRPTPGVNLRSAWRAAVRLRPASALDGVTAWVTRARRTRQDLSWYWRQFTRLRWTTVNPARAVRHAVEELALMRHLIRERRLGGQLPGLDASA